MSHSDEFDLQEECEPQGRDKVTPLHKGNGVDLDGMKAHREAFKERAKAYATGTHRAAEYEAEVWQLPEPPKGWPQFSPECLHGLAGEVVTTMMPYTEAHPMGLLLTFILSFGNVVGRQPYTRLGAASCHYTIENVVLIGYTGEGRKGEAAEINRRIFEAIDLDWVRKCCPTSVGSGQGIITAVRDPVWGMNKKTSLPEIVDPGVEDKRLMVDEREFSRMLTIMGMDQSIVSAVVCQAFDCHPYLRPVTKHNKETATNAHISIIGHITPRDLRQRLRLDLVENGFGNRFLYACVRREQILPSVTIPSDLFDRLAQKVQKAVIFARGVEEVGLTDEAQDLWKQMYLSLCKGSTDVDVDAMSARGAVHVRRLAMMLALLDQQALVAVVHLHTAMAIWRYSQASIRFVLGSSATNSQARTILDELTLVRPEGLTRTELNKLFNNRGLETTAATLAGLLAEGAVRKDVIKPLGRGKAKEVWYAA